MSKLQWFVSNTGVFTLHNVLVSRGLQFAISSPHPSASNPFVSLIFHGNHDQGFTFSPSTPFARLFSANIRLINFNNTGKPISPRPEHGSPHLVQPQPSRLITAQTKDSLQPQGTRTVLLSGDPPDRSEPHRQGFVGILKDCFYYHRCLAATFRALIQHRPNRISFFTSIARTTKSVWPSNLTKIITAGRVRWKRGFKFLETLRIFQHTDNQVLFPDCFCAIDSF